MGVRELGNPLGNPLALARGGGGAFPRIKKTYSRNASGKVFFDAPIQLGTAIVYATASYGQYDPGKLPYKATLDEFVYGKAPVFNAITYYGVASPGIQVTFEPDGVTLTALGATGYLSVLVLELDEKVRSIQNISLSANTSAADYSLKTPIKDPKKAFFTVAVGGQGSSGSLSTGGRIWEFGDYVRATSLENTASNASQVNFGFPNAETIRSYPSNGTSGFAQVTIVEFE